MDELEKMKKAKAYIKILSAGIDPITNQPITADTMKNPIIADYLKYICDILGRDIQICANKNFAERQKIPFYITNDQISQLRTFKSNVTSTQIAEEIRKVTEGNGTRLFERVFINNWLERIGMLEMSDNGRRATKKGTDLGIISELVSDKNNGGKKYYLNKFTTEAQIFIYQHIGEIIELNNVKKYPTQIDTVKLPDDKTIREFVTQSKDRCFIMAIGSCNSYENIGRYRAALSYNGKIKIIEKENISTNSANKCILFGLLEASKAIKKPTDIVIFSSTTLGFSYKKSPNYYLCAEILDLLKKANCKVSLCICSHRGIEFRQFISSLRET